VAAAETFAFAKTLGLSSRDTYQILMKSEGASWIMGDRGISMLNADWNAKSSVTIFTKDLVCLPSSIQMLHKGLFADP